MALDGGTFTYEGGRLALDPSTVVSGAWIDGPHGFLQLYSGPVAHCTGTIEAVFSGRVEETYQRRDGTLSVGTFTQYDQKDFRVVAHCSFACLTGRTFAVWGYNATSPAAVAEYFDAIAVHESGSGITVSPAARGGWRFQNGPSQLVHTVGDVAIHSLAPIDRPPSTLLLRGARTPAGSLTRSDRVDPKLFLTNEQVRLSAVPLGPEQVEPATAHLQQIRSLTYAPGPAA